MPVVPSPRPATFSDDDAPLITTKRFGEHLRAASRDSLASFDSVTGVFEKVLRSEREIGFVRETGSCLTTIPQT